eukprot:gnl/TRDRNA2_/TRDRNA2_29149_c0_seq1.p1 gnl/TRDRNA2_/TRDRNA2_29149_c0~~gnl/TRDRNA2_/TRDRNA2_29149_c0_seq1.p1  ORF type:complete len:209 (+),score=37.61 gnl/TRDRNA2_/TRDRNA2_29149_c0_seq1:105-731(+)
MTPVCVLAVILDAQTYAEARLRSFDDSSEDQRPAIRLKPGRKRKEPMPQRPFEVQRFNNTNLTASRIRTYHDTRSCWRRRNREEWACAAWLLDNLDHIYADFNISGMQAVELGMKMWSDFLPDDERKPYEDQAEQVFKNNSERKWPSDSEIVAVMESTLKTADLDLITRRTLRRSLEAHFGVKLRDRHKLIRVTLMRILKVLAREAKL